MSFVPSDFKTLIVTFENSSAANAFKTTASKLNLEIVHEYNLIKGLAVKVPHSLNVNELKNDKSHGIIHVEEDQEVKTN